MAETAEIKTADWEPLAPAIFPKFTDPDSCRIARPFVADGMLYATDGRICIRGPEPEGWTIPNPKLWPKRVADVFAAAFQPEPVEIPEIGPPCRECKGAATLPAHTCKMCNGMGSVAEYDCECPHCNGFHPCEQCKGQGNRDAGDCLWCRGSGVEDWSDPIELAPDYGVARQYAAKLRALGAVAYLPMDPNEDRPLRFTVDGFEGVLMPMTLAAVRMHREERRKRANPTPQPEGGSR